MTARTATTAPTRVLLVDDHDLIRQGLARAFERQDDFEVCGQAASVAEGIRQFTALEPEVVITDVRLPDGLGFELVRSIRETGHDTGVVVLTMYAGDDQLFNALEAGASAFVSKDAPAGEVVAAARHARVSPHSFAAADLPGAMKRKMTPVGPQLTQRETEVLKLLARGFSVSAIARSIFVSDSTAKTHISKIYEKLGASNRADAIMKAVRSRLLDDELGA
jgi:DNA-binding NarL/FixJ family response regulator